MFSSISVLQNAESVQGHQHHRTAHAGQAGELPDWKIPAGVEPLKALPAPQTEQGVKRDGAFNECRERWLSVRYVFRGVRVGQNKRVLNRRECCDCVAIRFRVLRCTFFLM